ncbi:superoxide dismutase family protein [Pseudonocardia nigra]|uniref:superoxide dismutase family protein n=1 Tax=Pseudonocardia nigra TaxID=1921578 RepID=UPI001C5D92B8|nr:superoxide dismutase family protein [Pseudonocardia nigra]
MTRATADPVRPSRLAVAAAGTLLTLAACAGPEPTEAPAQQPTEPTTEQPAPQAISAEGTLAPPEQATNAFTYDPALAPVGARLSVEAEESDGSTEVELEVDGLLPDRGYAVHAHARPCGPTGQAAGPHYQNEVDPAATPEQASADPAFANPRNEIWLDLTTDAEGDGEARSEVPFVFTDRAPASIVVHEAEATATAAGEAGAAGGRVACVDVPFA